jgi:hypothetical protein
MVLGLSSAVVLCMILLMQNHGENRVEAGELFLHF